MQSHDYEAYAVSSLPAATNARFDSFHRQRASLTPPDSVHSSRQNARSSRLPFAFRLDLRPIRGTGVHSDNFPQASLRKERVHLQFMPCDHTIGKQRLI